MPSSLAFCVLIHFVEGDWNSVDPLSHVSVVCVGILVQYIGARLRSSGHR